MPTLCLREIKEVERAKFYLHVQLSGEAVETFIHALHELAASLI